MHVASLMQRQWRNRILGGLPPGEMRQVGRHARQVELSRKHILFASGQRIDQICFPETCVVSLTVELPEGRDVDGAAIGYEGAVGIGGTLAKDFSFTNQTVQVAGAATMISREGILELQEACPVFADRLASYRDVFAAYVLQSLACALAHGAHERLARLLLQLQDRTSSANVALTHDALSAIVGTSRPTMSLLVRSFENANLINTRRGGITVVDRDGLERNACSCYRVTSDLFGKLGGDAPETKE